MFTFHLDKSTRKSSKTIKFRLYMPNADFFLTSLIQKVRSLTFSAKADHSGSTELGGRGGEGEGSIEAVQKSFVMKSPKKLEKHKKCFI